MTNDNWSDINEEIINNNNQRQKFLNNIRTNVSMPQRPKYSQEQHQTMPKERTTTAKKALKNKAKSMSKLKVFTSTILLTALATGGFAYSNLKQNEKNATSAQLEYEIAAIEDMKSKKTEELLETLTLNNGKIQIDMPYRIPEFYNVLKNTDIDELLCEYYKKPTKEAKELLLNQLQGREKEFAEMNFNLLKASFADTYINSPENYRITYNFTDNNYNSNINNDELITRENDRGTVLNIQTAKGNLQGYYRAGKSNFTEISLDFFELMSTAAKTYTDINYFNSKEDLMNSLMENYLEIKNSYIDGYTLAIHPKEHKLCYAKKDKNNELKYYNYDKKEIKEIQKNETTQNNER